MVDLAVLGATWSGTDIGRVVLQPDERRDEQRQRAEAQDHRAGPPAGGHGEAGQEREEDQLAGAVARPEDPDDQTAVLDEPARRDRRTEDAGDESRAEPGKHAEQERELPDLATQARREERRPGDDEAQQYDVLHADAPHQ